LRKEFLSQGTPGEQLTRRFQQAQVRFDAYVASEAVKVLRQRLEAVRKQHTIGAASDLDLLRAEIQLKEREAELALLARQLRELQAR
jgi:outer membrane protein TolC